MSENNSITMPTVKAKITWINSDPTQNKKAAASITIAEAFQIHGLSIVEGTKGLFISMPQRQTTDKNGEKKFFEIAHPISSEMRKAVYDAVFSAYSQTMAMTDQYKEGFLKDKKPEVGSHEHKSSSSAEESEASSTDQEDLEEEAEEDSFVPIMGQMA